VNVLYSCVLAVVLALLLASCGVGGELVRIDPRLTVTTEEQPQPVPLTVPMTAPPPLIAGTSVRVCDGNQCVTVQSGTVFGGRTYQAMPVVRGPVCGSAGFGTGWYPGKFIKSFFGGCR